MALMYKPNPVLLVAADDGAVLLAIVPRELPLTPGDLFDLRRQAEDVGLRLLVVESVAVDAGAWLEDAFVSAARRRDAAATAQRSGIVRRLDRRSDTRQPKDVPAHPGADRWALTRAIELANEHPVSLSALCEKYCRGTRLSDAMRLPKW